MAVPSVPAGSLVDAARADRRDLGLAACFSCQSATTRTLATGPDPPLGHDGGKPEHLVILTAKIARLVGDPGPE